LPLTAFSAVVNTVEAAEPRPRWGHRLAWNVVQEFGHVLTYVLRFGDFQFQRFMIASQGAFRGLEVH